MLAGHAEHPGPRESSASLSSPEDAGFGAKELLRGMCFQPSSGEGQVAMTKAFGRMVWDGRKTREKPRREKHRSQLSICHHFSTPSDWDLGLSFMGIRKGLQLP